MALYLTPTFTGVSACGTKPHFPEEHLYLPGAAHLPAAVARTQATSFCERLNALYDANGNPVDPCALVINDDVEILDLPYPARLHAVIVRKTFPAGYVPGLTLEIRRQSTGAPLQWQQRLRRFRQSVAPTLNGVVTAGPAPLTGVGPAATANTTEQHDVYVLDPQGNVVVTPDRLLARITGMPAWTPTPPTPTLCGPQGPCCTRNLTQSIRFSFVFEAYE